MSDSPLIVSTETLAKLLRISARHVRRLASDSVLPLAGSSPRAGFDLTICVPKYLAHLEGEASGSLSEARRKLVEAQRRDLENRMRRREGETIDRPDVQRVFLASMTSVGSQLDGLAGRLCGELAGLSDPAAVREVLFRECRRIRNAAAAELEAIAGAAGGSEGAAGATSDAAA
jgi:hypothetical protein